ncbi:MAG: YdeI/OmpD-associated family protein [Caldilineaceae bacterium]|nr:YdeI/OmpD-associated family protein [Caldilineaceae bacterium]
MNPAIDLYLAEGCGRCPLWQTPQCKVHDWQAELKALRPILLSSGLTEELKWKMPCYTFENNNVVLMSAFKEYCALSFFKGALLKDPQGILEKPGENTQAARLIRFTNVQQIVDLAPVIGAYIAEAIAVEKAGLTVEFKPIDELAIPAELQAKFDEDPAFQMAFEALTPGRQRGYILHFVGAKQSSTRTSRIAKYMQKIFDGQGMYDR